MFVRQDKITSKLRIVYDSSARSTGSKQRHSPRYPKILGVQWYFTNDRFIFDISDVACYTTDSEPTKRTVVGVVATCLFDLVGIVIPVIILFKMFCQQLCEVGVGWDDPLTDDLLERWRQLHSSLYGASVITIPRSYISRQHESARLVGFCDTSTKAYAAVVYLRLEHDTNVYVRFVAAKTRVAPQKGMTIPCLELLSTLLLTKLIVSVHAALQAEFTLHGEPVCNTDSKISFYWIQRSNREQRQFIENHVISIHSLVPSQHWKYCPGVKCKYLHE